MRLATTHRQKIAARLAARAHSMRRQMTPSEALLWHHGLRAGQLGVAFKRQVPLCGRFIADFVAPARRLVVEVDGGWHTRRGAADRRRDAALARAGYRVLRIEAELVHRDLPAALSRVRAALAERG